MNDTVFVVVAQQTGSDQVRRVFTNREAAEEYVADDRNLGNFYIEKHGLDDEWEPVRPYD